MKTTVPEQLKADVPQTTWGKILVATPVVMAVVATMLAGLASSEMTRAQYDRSLAAQQQSKAGDQWSFFQAKKLRGAMQRSTLDILQSTLQLGAIDSNTLQQLGETNAVAIAALQKSQLPEIALLSLDPKLNAALDAVHNSRPETEVLAVLASIKVSDLELALKAAQDHAQNFDNALQPITRALDAIEKNAVGSMPETVRNITAARLRFAAARYDAESRLNQSIADIYELLVRKSNISADHHRRRSQKFFFGMLAAQAAVIIATFSIAARKRTFLWTVAAVAGIAAICFAIYVYLYV